ncbi:phenol acid carboxylase [Penicillium capsulatum]|uniref:Phenol acid carboxylase n=1 Tax=Penicillium capsulatum TaxID=69766 RepID=A0A9W9LG14_9EURO|nr:phenol acid carboxylase [Penicillium capsulatum]KAJ6105949.1 phenol acid carboxylase [Penicillium capsulatum]
MPIKSTLQGGATFDADLRDRHLVYDYAVEDDHGSISKWRYEFWFFNEDRVVYAIHGGPMAGRQNYQAATYQCIRPGELWQCNWLEETGTIVSMVYDLQQNRITTMLAFSQGHWEQNEAAHGDKRNPEDFDRWRGLAKVGTQMDRVILCEQASIVEDFRGAGDLKPIEMDWATL